MTGFLATVTPRKLASRELDASVGASGPHAFAVRKKNALVSGAARVHRILSRVRDDLEPPLQWDRTAGDMRVICVEAEEEIFLQKGLDSHTQKRPADLPDGQISAPSSRP